jgi:FKBP-type peptidyl-prolyl cis-trans isomerase FkpA
MKQIFFILLSASLLLVYCKKKSTNSAVSDTGCKTEASNSVAPANEVTALENYLGQNSIVATKHPRGFYYKIDTLGTGDFIATLCSSVKVLYKGSLTNGQIFDQTSGSARSFTLSNLIQGWQTGIPLIKKSGKIKYF